MIFDLILIVIAVAAVIAAIHYRAQAKTAEVKSTYHTTVGNELTSVRNELENTVGTVRSIIDRKFEVLGKWLAEEFDKRAELSKAAPPVVGLTAAAAAIPPNTPLAPITDDDASKMLTQMSTAIGELTEKRAKLEEVLRAKQKADNAVREVLGE